MMSDEFERRQRDEAVRNAVAVSAFEGGEPSPYAAEQMRLFVDGEISVEEMRDRIVRHATIPE